MADDGADNGITLEYLFRVGNSWLGILKLFPDNNTTLNLYFQLAGATYMDVHKAGGGIHFTVDHVHKASEDELYGNLKEILPRMLQAGTTLLEAKSGYGLDTENEMKMLKVLERAKNDGPLEISSTYCGAHAVPR
jgi:imidazolonepropionase